MNPNNKILHSIWNQSTDIATSQDLSPDHIKIDELLANVFCPGPYYYYVVDFYDRQIKHVSPEIKDILGLNPESAIFDDIIARIHPKDIHYVAKAEAAVLYYLYNNIKPEPVTSFKNSYCFRLLTKDGSYQLFQHQSLILTTDQRGGFSKALNIHTNISHFTTLNNYKATISCLLGEQKYISLDILKSDDLKYPPAPFSKREIEIIRLIAAGMNSQKIADTLYISAHTVKKHRVNITQKSGVKSSGELVARCIKEGLI